MLKQTENSSNIFKKSFIREHLDLASPKSVRSLGGGANGTLGG